MQVCVWMLIFWVSFGPVLFGSEQSLPNSFWMPSHRLNSATGEQKITQLQLHRPLHWLPDSQAVAELISAKRPAKKRKPPNFYVFGVMRSGIEPRPLTPWVDALNTRLRGWSWNAMEGVYNLYIYLLLDTDKFNTLVFHNMPSYKLPYT